MHTFLDLVCPKITATENLCGIEKSHMWLLKVYIANVFDKIQAKSWNRLRRTRNDRKASKDEPCTTDNFDFAIAIQDRRDLYARTEIFINKDQ